MHGTFYTDEGDMPPGMDCTAKDNLWMEINVFLKKQANRAARGNVAASAFMALLQEASSNNTLEHLTSFYKDITNANKVIDDEPAKKADA